VLGFRADPRERLRPLLSELLSLHQAYTEKPIFGVEMTWANEVGGLITYSGMGHTNGNLISLFWWSFIQRVWYIPYQAETYPC
jgi:hypothetical protein